jgi:TPR repeat protein
LTSAMLLGRSLFSGTGVAKGESEAARYYRLAEGRGLVEAQFSVGVCFGGGVGVPKDEPEAIRFYRLAADQGVALAQNHLGLSFFHGKGVPKDEREAVRYFRMAVVQGQAQAQYSVVATAAEMASAKTRALWRPWGRLARRCPQARDSLLRRHFSADARHVGQGREQLRRVLLWEEVQPALRVGLAADQAPKKPRGGFSVLRSKGSQVRSTPVVLRSSVASARTAARSASNKTASNTVAAARRPRTVRPNTNLLTGHGACSWRVLPGLSVIISLHSSFCIRQQYIH